MPTVTDNPRRPMQLTACGEPNRTTLFALCSDDSIWVLHLDRKRRRWQRLPLIPNQDLGVEAADFLIQDIKTFLKERGY